MVHHNPGLHGKWDNFGNTGTPEHWKRRGNTKISNIFMYMAYPVIHSTIIVKFNVLSKKPIESTRMWRLQGPPALVARL